MSENSKLGGKVRALRRRHGMTQKRLATQLAISPSYLNLIEHDRRPLPAPLLIKLAQVFQIDLQAFASDAEADLISGMMEVFGDPLFDNFELIADEVRDFARSAPSLARSVLTLFQAYRSAREQTETLAERLTLSGNESVLTGIRTPAEEVSDYVQRNSNYFPELEESAEALQKAAGLGTGERDLYGALMHFLKRNHDVETSILTVAEMGGAVRRYDPERRVLTLSEVLRRGSRNFQLAHQVALINNSDIIERLVEDPHLTSEESRQLGRIVLANYFAAAVLMPYERFITAARAERYDIELLGNRFRTSEEQICHRLTSMRRPGNEGVPFHFIRVDIAGNISKRFSASGMRFARYSGACPLWNVYAAFLTPGMVRTQVSSMPNGTAYFDVAKTLSKDAGAYRRRQTLQAINLGCEIAHAHELIYADGVDLGRLEAAIPIGSTCRLCERSSCNQRAFPSIYRPLRVSENQRRLSFYGGEED